MVCDLFFGAGKLPKMTVRDTKLFLDLFLNNTTVISTPDFNMLYDLFLGKNVKQFSAKNAGSIIDLFFGYGKKPTMKAKD